MSILEYFEPVSLDKPEDENLLLNQNVLCRNIDIHVPDTNIADLSSYDIVIFGVPEFRACAQKGIEPSTDFVREKLYQLNFFDKKIRILDLGNLKLGNTISDTYYGLRDVLLDILALKIVPIIIGGSQDLTYGITLAFEYLKKNYTLATVDSRIDVAFENFTVIGNKNYLNSIVMDSSFLFEQINLGHQACFANADCNDIYESLFHENMRLGILRNNIRIAEPFLRDSNIVSIDFSCVKYADAPGQLSITPNGFNAEDICQVAHYSGLSENVKVFALFDLANNNDSLKVTASLAAETIWYFINSFAVKPKEFPGLSPEQFMHYIVSFDEDNRITFFKSQLSNRWWCEVPVKEGLPHIIACSEEDYKMASQNLIPDRWLKLFKKLN